MYKCETAKILPWLKKSLRHFSKYLEMNLSSLTSKWMFSTHIRVIKRKAEK